MKEQERFKPGEFKFTQRRVFRRVKGEPQSLSQMPDRETLEDFLKGVFYTSDTVYNSGRGKFEKRKK